MATKRRRQRAAATTRQPAKGRSTWVVFLAGLIVGACGAVVAQNSSLADRLVALVTPGAGSGAGQTEVVATKQPPADSKPRFKFYTMLPEMEVAVPEDELKSVAGKPQASTPPPQPTTPAADPPADSPADPPRAEKAASAAGDAKPAARNGSYVLQLGSFSSPTDAERLKANLALLGLQAHIQRVQINDTDTFHRVRAGPYASLEAVNEARQSLRSNNVDSMVFKVRQ